MSLHHTAGQGRGARLANEVRMQPPSPTWQTPDVLANAQFRGGADESGRRPGHGPDPLAIRAQLATADA